MCDAVLKIFDAPPATWHVEQLPAAVAGCEKFAPVQTVVDVWQVSHCAVVDTCVAVFVSALTAVNAPLWQVEQLPAAIGPLVPEWLITAGLNVVVFLWQVSHCALVGMCPEFFARPEPPVTWHVEQAPAEFAG